MRAGSRVLHSRGPCFQWMVRLSQCLEPLCSLQCLLPGLPVALQMLVPQTRPPMVQQPSPPRLLLLLPMLLLALLLLSGA